MDDRYKVATEVAMDYIDNAIYEGAYVISWRSISAAVWDAQAASPKGWVHVRDVVQAYLNEGSLVRTANKRVEEYRVDIGAWLAGQNAN